MMMYLDADVHDALRKSAKENHRSVSAQIRWLIEKWLREGKE